jgi:hypothetical protein
VASPEEVEEVEEVPFNPYQSIVEY